MKLRHVVYTSMVMFCAGLVWVYGWKRYVHHDGPSSVVIQNIQDNVHGDRHYCTEGEKDCQYNTDFFRDTWLTGQVDLDPTTHYDVDSNPMVLVQD